MENRAVRQPWGAEVMATGIVSIALRLAGVMWAARGLLVITAALWVVLVVTFCGLLADGSRRDELSVPAILTSVAGTGVLGNGIALSGHAVTAVVPLVIAFGLWMFLLPRVLRRLKRRLPGAAYLVTVATQSVVVLAATLADLLPAHLLTWPAGTLLALGLGLYVFVLSRFDFRQLYRGSGDHWVLAGSLSISALASARVTNAAGDPRPLEWLTFAVLGVALAWYAVLVVCEVLVPRPRYDPRRWSTVFPLGMTAASAMTAGAVCSLPWLGTLGKVLLWPAVAAWLVVGAGAIRQAVAASRS
ncbi:tellurite resistance/C4-dicarboxylate transporter family protein [Actinomadura litoris]|nr:tellurite resistance/C4-dicarboxylate transporter family protein [Actinomadura litoris]